MESESLFEEPLDESESDDELLRLEEESAEIINRNETSTVDSSPHQKLHQTYRLRSL